MYLVLIFAFALAVALFAVQNSAMVEVRLFRWSWEVSLVMVILGSAAAGVLMTGLIGLVSSVRLRLRIRELEGRIRRMETELKSATPSAPSAPQKDVSGTVEQGGQK